MNGVWHHYDGLWERNSRGQGKIVRVHMNVVPRSAINTIGETENQL